MGRVGCDEYEACLQPSRQLKDVQVQRKPESYTMWTVFVGGCQIVSDISVILLRRGQGRWNNERERNSKAQRRRARLRKRQSRSDEGIPLHEQTLKTHTNKCEQ